MRHHLSLTLLYLTVLCFLGLTTAQELTAFNEARALLEYEANTVEVAGRYGASVVEVRVVLDAKFRDSVERPTHGAVSTTLRSGSGFLIHLSGQPFFITSYHVLNATATEAKEAEGAIFEVVFSALSAPWPSLPVRLRYVVPEWDIALLEPHEPNEVPDVPPIPLGDSNNLQLGQKVIAIGGPFGLNSTVTTGTVSALNRQVPGGFPPMIQTDAAINHGSSGGPLLNSSGEVVGVATAIYNPEGDTFAGVSLAVPLHPLLKGLAGLGLFPEPYRYIPEVTLTDVRELPRSVQVLYGVPEEGWLVLSVAPGGAAAKAGLQGGSRRIVYGTSQWLMGGDVIVAVEEVAWDAPKPLPSTEESADGGRVCEVTVVRDGQRVSLLLPQAALAEDHQACSK